MTALWTWCEGWRGGEGGRGGGWGVRAVFFGRPCVPSRPSFSPHPRAHTRVCMLRKHAHRGHSRYAAAPPDSRTHLPCRHLGTRLRPLDGDGDDVPYAPDAARLVDALHDFGARVAGDLRGGGGEGGGGLLSGECAALPARGGHAPLALLGAHQQLGAVGDHGGRGEKESGESEESIFTLPCFFFFFFSFTPPRCASSPSSPSSPWRPP